MWLLLIAALGMLVPNGLFVHWLATSFQSFGQFLDDELALAFILDLFLATAVLSFLFAVKPVGRVRWPWFVALSLLGGLGFSIPFYLWLNWRLAPKSDGAFASWWRAA